MAVMAMSLPRLGYAQTSPTTYTYTGSPEVFTVPTGVTTLTVVLNGAQGGGGSTGLGGRATASLTVTPGQSLTLRVGGKGDDNGPGGYNGGGAGAGVDAGGGGGASDIRMNGDALSNRVLVAGGGGGGNGAGAGGEIRGSGTPGQGGNGEDLGDGAPGGGGGYYGGFGSIGDGGSQGGSSYPDPANLPANSPVTSVVHEQGVNTGNGSITLSWVAAGCVPPTFYITADPGQYICAGTSVVLAAQGSVAPDNARQNGSARLALPVSPLSYRWSTGANSSSITVAPGVTTVYSVTAYDGNCASAPESVTITVNPLPTVTIAFPESAQVRPGPVITVPLGQGLTYQVFGGGPNSRYERKIVEAMINGFLIRTVVENSDGIFQLDRPGPYSINVTDANGCSRTVSGEVQGR